MIQTTEDVFFLTVSLAIGLLTILAAWGLIQLNLSVRDVRNITKNFKQKINNVVNVLDTIKDKIEAAVSSSQNITKTIGNVVDIIEDTKKKFTKKNGKNKK